MDFYEEEPTQVELNPNPALRTAQTAARLFSGRRVPRTQPRESLQLRAKWLRAFTARLAEGAEDARPRLSTQPASCNILLVVIRHPLYLRKHRAM